MLSRRFLATGVNKAQRPPSREVDQALRMPSKSGFVIIDRHSGRGEEKMFDPFFTTKPPWALHYSRHHRQATWCSIEVDTKLGEFAEVRLILPPTQ
jgi:hypothetical protein